jgi:5-methylthioadenosine/S-adenosylhomocysteine deaminase
MAILIQHASYVVRDANRVDRDTDVLIVDDRIAAVGKVDLPSLEGVQVLDGRNRAVIPGLVNAHTHLYQNFLKGLRDDIGLVEWCNDTLYPMSWAIHEAEWQRNDQSCGYHWGILSAIEMIRGGVTSCIDMNMNMDSVFRAWIDIGMRGVGAVALSDRWLPVPLRRDPAVSRSEALRLARDWHGAHPRVNTVLAPSTPFLCSRELLEWARDQAENIGIGLQIHLAETRYEVENVQRESGLTPIAYAAGLGLLKPGTTAVHCVHVSDEEIDILKESGAVMVHCPKSNLKLGSGIAPLSKIMNKGVPIALAADGAASNDSLDMFEETRMAALLHKGALENPMAITARDAFRMATQGGAQAAGLNAGTVDPGRLADLAILNLDQAHLLPLHDIVNTLVYCAKSSDVESTIIDGRLVMDRGTLTTVDQAAVQAEAAAFGGELYRHGMQGWQAVNAVREQNAG